jgi:hypothetical protein
MPLTAEDVLAKLNKAIDEGRQMTRELHSARAAALDVVKKHRAGIIEAINLAVKEQVGAISAQTREEMRTRAADLVEGIARDLRNRLGLEEEGS